MSYTQKTWVARQGTGLNKFIIGEKDANGKQTITTSPDSVTVQGDVLSAASLNDLETRIFTAFSNIAVDNHDNPVDWYMDSSVSIDIDIGQYGIGQLVVERIKEINVTSRQLSMTINVPAPAGGGTPPQAIMGISGQSAWGQNGEISRFWFVRTSGQVAQLTISPSADFTTVTVVFIRTA